VLVQQSGPWTVNQAKTHLSTLLRKAREGEPQIIGIRDRCVLIPLEEFQKQKRLPLGSWLVQECAKLSLEDEDLELPSRKDSRPIPFSDEMEI